MQASLYNDANRLSEVTLLEQSNMGANKVY